jgi:flagellar assembly factor FliW
MITLTVNYSGQPEELHITNEQIITFPGGLVGCADWRRFVLLSDEETANLHILQSLDEASIHFLVTDPLLVEPDYQATISPEELERLDLDRPEDGVVLCILTSRGDPPQVTANLLGPLVLNPVARLGTQLVLVDSPYSTRHPLPFTQSAEGEAVEC